MTTYQELTKQDLLRKIDEYDESLQRWDYIKGQVETVAHKAYIETDVKQMRKSNSNLFVVNRMIQSLRQEKEEVIQRYLDFMYQEVLKE